MDSPAARGRELVESWLGHLRRDRHGLPVPYINVPPRRDAGARRDTEAGAYRPARTVIAMDSPATRGAGGDRD